MLEAKYLEMQMKECADLILKNTEKSSRYLKVYILANVTISAS
jgi:hypothetical protein